MLDIFALMGGDVYIANNSQLCFSTSQNLLYWGPRTGSYLEYGLDAVAWQKHTVDGIPHIVGMLGEPGICIGKNRE